MVYTLTELGSMTIFRLKTQGAERETDQIQRGKLSKERNTRDPTEVSRAGVTTGHDRASRLHPFRR